MNSIDNQRKMWRDRWLSCINELTSLELQQKSWLDNTITNPHWSFIEFMCSYFDDLNIDNQYEFQLKNNWVTRNKIQTIQDWHNLLDKYNSPNNDDHDPESILNDKDWLSIIEIGKKAKENLSEILNKEESQILNYSIDHNQFK